MIKPNDVTKVFAILDGDEAESAQASFFKNYSRNSSIFSDPLKWLDLDKDGTFLRAGISDINDRTDTLISEFSQDKEIELMQEVLLATAAKPGDVVSFGSQESFIWLLPYSRPSETHARALLVSFNLVADSLEYFNHDAGLTIAEKRITAQLIVGKSLRSAAYDDAVSVETKRSQLKATCLKLACNGQNDLIRTTMGQLVHLLNLSGSEGDRDQITEDFVADYCPAGTHFKLHRLEDDRFLRVIECGPSDGKPIILFHSMTFAPLLTSAISELDKLDIRLIMPVRPGYLESAVVLFEKEGIDQFCGDIASYKKLSKYRSGPILGHGFAGTVALRYAELYPKSVSSIALLSFPVRSEALERDSLQRRFFGSFAKLATSPEIFRLLAKEFRRRYATPKSMRRALQRLFRESPSDVAALEGQGSGQPAYPALQVSFQSSYVGVADDFYTFYKELFGKLFETAKLPLLAIHGAADRANPLAAIEVLLDSTRGDHLAVIDGGGQFCFVSHPAEVWEQIARWAVIDAHN
ncbi:alpha/beta hydrolase [uncultured Roseobacter sp.]|uniref:alpha/beta fold hydrolase n=1 Tax=uncultured Roseobacter sp. TaxID=114847 RepID=UPI002617267B|nr:alpha/beta hydrolase [uncultured Roseobacter sp.]